MSPTTTTTTSSSSSNSSRRRPRFLLTTTTATILLAFLLGGAEAKKRIRHPSAPADDGLPPDTQNPVSANVDYPFPYIYGHPIDHCLTTAGASDDCGKPAADFFCHFQKCEAAVSFQESQGNRGPTWVASDNVIRPSGGGSFDKITCECSIPDSTAPGTSDANLINYNNPQILGHPVDFCLKKGKIECGKPAADAFCQSFGNTNSTAYVEEAKPKNPTWLIGDHALSQEDGRKSFKSITCV